MADLSSLLNKICLRPPGKQTEALVAVLRVVEKMANRLQTSAQNLVGNAALAVKLVAKEFVDDRVGLPTVQDILAELAKPGRDPRSEFRVAAFAEGINELEDLSEGMTLEGVVTNVTRFGLKRRNPGGDRGFWFV